MYTWDLQKSKAAALTTAMALVQRALDEDKPRPKRDSTSLSSLGRGDAFPRGASSDASSPKDDKDESMEDGRAAPAAAASPSDAASAPAPCQAARDAEGAGRPAAEPLEDTLEEPQGLPISAAPEADA